MKPHKWQKEIIAWANGEIIQSRAKGLVDWYDCDDPRWLEGYEYRIKPKEDSLQKEKEHWKNGGDVQYYNPYEKQWFDLINKPNCEPDWNGLFTIWRIKPKEFKWQKVKDHWEKGGKIQYGKSETGIWHDFLYDVDFGLRPDWSSLEWRIKPKEFKWQKEKDHWEKGGKIQYKNQNTLEWEDYCWAKSQPNWYQFEWRIKPEESKIEYSFNDQVREDIEDILDCFDFQRVLEVMNALDWTYWYTDGVPEIWDVRKLARERLAAAVTGLIRSGEKRYFSSSGGFHAEAEIEEGNPKIYLRLSFVVSDWDNFD